MKEYWPAGVYQTSDGRQEHTTSYDAFPSEAEARQQIELWKDWYKFNITFAWITVIEKGDLIEMIDVIHPKEVK